jgi:sulfate adenylyltransferase
MVGTDRFVEIFVDTPLEVCEERDAKGMYAKARRGEIKEFTGVSDPYEIPLNPEITFETIRHTPQENAHSILNYLVRRGLVKRSEARPGLRLP